jgi:CRP/FNR family cyclic AMP-dependent transcriptional regulator
MPQEPWDNVWLSQTPFFKGMSERQLVLLVPLLTHRCFPKNGMIFEQVQPARFVYILIQGEVIIQYKPYDASIINVARIEPGGVFGWSAALRHELYSSAAVAVSDSEVYQLRGSDLHRMCEQDPDTGSLIISRMASVVAQRLHATYDQILAVLSQGMDFDNDHHRRS